MFTLERMLKDHKKIKKLIKAGVLEQIGWHRIGSGTELQETWYKTARQSAESWRGWEPVYRVVNNG